MRIPTMVSRLSVLLSSRRALPATLMMLQGLLLMQASPLMADSRAPRLIYEIFTRSFQDSDGDGIGDLEGVRQRLDYLQALQVDAIWLTPVFDSPSYHGYDVTDYEQIQQEYGTIDSLKNLIGEAHQRGIRVILDIPVNHTSIQHPWFQASAAHRADRDLYLWSKQPLAWGHFPLNLGESLMDHWRLYGYQYFFSSFEGGTMPDLNWRNPEVLARIQGVFEFWARNGVDGFRLDAARYLVKGPDGEVNQPETHAIWRQIVAAVRAINPGAYMIGEVSDSSQVIASYYGSGDEFDAAFDFPVALGLRDSLRRMDSSSFFSALSERQSNLPAPDFFSPFVGSHDLGHLASEVQGDWASQKLAALAVLSLPGTATIYAGDEIGMPNGTQPGDVSKRTPMIWSGDASHGFTASPGRQWTGFSTEDPAVTVFGQAQDPNSLLGVYHQLIQLRNQNSELLNGALENLAQPAPGVVSFTRSDVLVVLNFSSNDIDELTVAIPASSSNDGISRLYGDAEAQKNDAISVRIRALHRVSGAVFKF